MMCYESSRALFHKYTKKAPEWFGNSLFVCDI